jgi:hypothetical protein
MDADTKTPGLGVQAEEPRQRRAFLKRAGLVAAGITAAAPVAGARAASPATVAYTDEPNVFTRDQTVDARLSVTSNDPSTWQPTLTVERQDNQGFAGSFESATTALLVGQAQDLQGVQWDTMDVFHKGTGDGVYVDHKGGIPSGYTGPTGGNAGFNCLIPYYIDAGGTGREGTTPNTRTGMRGVFLNVQPPNNDVIALEINHSTNSYAQYLKIQPPNFPQGTGGGIAMEDYSRASSIRISKWSAPNGSEAIVALHSQTTDPIPALRVQSSNSATTALVRSDGTAAFGTGNPYAVRVQAEMPSSGIARNLALSNSTGGTGAGVQIEFDDRAAQYAQIQATFDSASPRNGSLKLRVSQSDSMIDRITMNATGIGFFGAKPVARPTVSGNRGGSTALANLLSALQSLGLIVDASS